MDIKQKNRSKTFDSILKDFVELQELQECTELDYIEFRSDIYNLINR